MLDLQKQVDLVDPDEDEEAKEEIEEIEQKFAHLMTRPLFKELNIKAILKKQTYRSK